MDEIDHTTVEEFSITQNTNNFIDYSNGDALLPLCLQFEKMLSRRKY
jgi:hypothetical protein